eukprot:365763-Chlamydomonas_euryale.AAC.28
MHGNIPDCMLRVKEFKRACCRRSSSVLMLVCQSWLMNMALAAYSSTNHTMTSAEGLIMSASIASHTSGYNIHTTVVSNSITLNDACVWESRDIADELQQVRECTS